LSRIGRNLQIAINQIDVDNAGVNKAPRRCFIQQWINIRSSISDVITQKSQIQQFTSYNTQM
uniref:Transposase n=1 Tax=Brugia timori TaxID=42155 RepID=A0A0R3QUB0_9BILA